MFRKSYYKTFLYLLISSCLLLLSCHKQKEHLRNYRDKHPEEKKISHVEHGKLHSKKYFDNYLKSKGILNDNLLKDSYINSNKKNKQEPLGLKFQIENDSLIMDFYLYGSGSCRRFSSLEKHTDTLQVTFSENYCASVRGEYYEILQMKIPLNEYKFEYLAFTNTKIVKSFSELNKKK